jgi:hypothetical protein
MEKKAGPRLDNHIGCFGEFNPEDKICRNCCALCLRCAIESDQITKMEILEDLFFAEATNAKMQ